jgi:hypothetical protein
MLEQGSVMALGSGGLGLHAPGSATRIMIETAVAGIVGWNTTGRGSLETPSTLKSRFGASASNNGTVGDSAPSYQRVIGKRRCVRLTTATATVVQKTARNVV